MMHTKHHKSHSKSNWTVWARLSVRRELSLWACLFAVLFQLASPLVQAAVPNGALAQGTVDFPFGQGEICSAFGNRISDDPSQEMPTHHAMACEFCALCQAMHHDGKIPLVVSNNGFVEVSTLGYLVPTARELQLNQSGSVYGVIRGPPVLL